ncbi:unnamed protein product [Caenorhabditis nigoni]
MRPRHSSLNSHRLIPGATPPSAFRPPIAPVIPKPTTSSTFATSSSGKQASRSPIIIVPSAMNMMVNLYNVRDILQNFPKIFLLKSNIEANKCCFPFQKSHFDSRYLKF